MKTELADGVIKKTKITTEVSEIFSSLQGEGPYLGKKQIFLRFGQCNMHCGYCDEVDKMKKGNFSTMPLTRVVDSIQNLENIEGPHHSVSLTGGEPLIYSPFLSNLLPELKKRKFTLFLESNGTLPRILDKHLSYIDIVSMDMKPPSSSGDKEYWKEHKQFLKIANQKEVFVKVVVTSDTVFEEIKECIHIVEKINSSIPFIFQPESEWNGINLKAMELIQSYYLDYASNTLKDVRVIPQMHKIWNIR